MWPPLRSVVSQYAVIEVLRRAASTHAGFHWHMSAPEHAVVRQPMGVGELILAAMDAGAREIFSARRKLQPCRRRDVASAPAGVTNEDNEHVGQLRYSRYPISPLPATSSLTCTSERTSTAVTIMSDIAQPPADNLDPSAYGGRASGRSRCGNIPPEEHCSRMRAIGRRASTEHYRMGNTLRFARAHPEQYARVHENRGSMSSQLTRRSLRVALPVVLSYDEPGHRDRWRRTARSYQSLAVSGIGQSRRSEVGSIRDQVRTSTVRSASPSPSAMGIPPGSGSPFTTRDDMSVDHGLQAREVDRADR
ncbi:hypothetical protein FQA39_LY18694 [Lamprigera yunnana]|nr:hypothetical protein FQA39_LY18694 [Lamprigera yunnana]